MSNTTSAATHWTLYVPDEHCEPGLEVGISAQKNGLKVGDMLITWDQIESAKHKVGGSVFSD